MTVVLTESKEVFVMGSNIDGQLGIKEVKKFSSIHPMKVNIPNEIDLIMCGLNHVFALNSKRNIIFAWGSNKHGQINPFS